MRTGRSCELIDDASHLLDRLERSGPVAVGGVDHEHVDAEVQHGLGLDRRMAIDAERHGDAQAAVRVDVGAIQGRAQRALAGDRPDQPAVLDHGRRAHAVVGEPFEDLG